MFAGTPEALRPGRGLSRLGLEAALSGHVMGGRQSGVGQCGHPSLEPGSVGGSLLPPHSAPVWPKSQPEEAQSPPVKPGKTGVVRHLEPPGLTFQMRKLRRWEVQWFEQSSELRLVEQG